MKKRIVSALLVCVLGMSLVTGCGNNAKAAETTKTADGKIQLDLWYSGGKNSSQCISGHCRMHSMSLRTI